MDDKQLIRRSITRRAAFVAAKAAWFLVSITGPSSEKRAKAVKAAEERARKALGTLLLYEEGPSALENIVSTAKPSPQALPTEWVEEAGFTPAEVEQVRSAMTTRNDALESAARDLFKQWLMQAKPGEDTEEPEEEHREVFLKHKPSVSELASLIKACQRAKSWALRDAMRGDLVALTTDCPLINQTQQRLQALLDAAEEAAEEAFEQRPATIEEMVVRL